MASRYLMVVKDRITGEMAEFAPGQRAEIDLVEDSVRNAVRLGIGLGRTSAQASGIRSPRSQGVSASNLPVG